MVAGIICVVDLIVILPQLINVKYEKCIFGLQSSQYLDAKVVFTITFAVRFL